MRNVVSKAKAYLKVRQQAVRGAMKKLNLDGLLLNAQSDLAYLTNFTGDDSIGIITANNFILVTDFRYTEQAEIEAGWLKAVTREGKMDTALAGAILETKAKRVGFEANRATFGQIHALDKAIKDKAGKEVVELVPVEDVLLNIRKVKDDHEIDLIRKSAAIAEEAFTAIKDQIKVGQSESYLAGLLVFELRSRGASDSSFPVIIAAGANSSLPHYRPTDALVRKDEPVLVDWGAMFDGYCSDITRTMLVGRTSGKIKEIYKVVLEAQEAAIKFLRPGVTTQQADRVARDVIDKAGFKEKFGHGLGHGIGREIHELPTMRRTGGEEELRPGMIVTVEPGIYLPGEGGVRIEDDVLITHSGCEVLTTLDKTFEGCHLE
ncbi:MAG TPA: Xaa-Pro peptidase family protein [Tepidisphaeraceae bacterium]|jgi:Xaa-Pro aminopeptidase|nr:Xaa-Pro peptidase family protein [Tepidisphaeraceae bacterium]